MKYKQWLDQGKDILRNANIDNIMLKTSEDNQDNVEESLISF